MEENVPVLKELLEHLDNPSFFHQDTDSFAAATGVEMLCDDGRQEFVLGLINLIQRFKHQYIQAYDEARTFLLENERITHEKCKELFDEWDKTYALEKRPKSDVIYREFAKEFNWELPQDCFIGWDIEPIPEYNVEDAK